MAGSNARVARYRAFVGSGGGSNSILLDPQNNSGDRLESVVMYFGSGGNDYYAPSNGTVVLFPNYGEFDRTLHLLQTERPIHFSWNANDTTNRINWYSVGTGPEPPGEGLAGD